MNSCSYCPHFLSDLDETGGRDLHVTILNIYEFHKNWRRGGCTFLTGLRVFHETIRFFESKIHIPRHGQRRLQSFHFLIYRYLISQACFPCPIPQNRGHHELIGLFSVYLGHYSFDVSSTFQITIRIFLLGKDSQCTVLFYYYVFTRILIKKNTGLCCYCYCCNIYCLFKVSCSFQAAMTTSVDRDTIKEAYEDVRSDSTETEW